ncbi:MAG: hypothetical protein HY540_01240, partial [Deltaproteobacteria bacterium]|nr:hypothetical protein [Deltaproteobacteria bacterium]
MIPEVQKIRWPKKLPSLLFAGIAIGVVSFVIGLATDSQRAWANFLLEYFFWITVAIGGVFFVALQHITGSSWSAPLRRIPEAFVAYLPAAALLFIVLCFGLHSIYEWTHEQVVAQDAILKLKVGYLNIPFFAFRNVGLLAIAGIAGFLMTRNSLRQDVSGDIALTQKNTTISAVFLLLFAWSFSFASFDLIMSLAPHWFST